MTRPYYEGGGITLFHGRCEDLLPALEPVAVTLTDPPYSEHVHAKSRAGTKGAGGKERDFGFGALSPELMEFAAREFARLTRRWVLVFSDERIPHLWRAELEAAGLEYVRTGIWVKIGAAPQFTGDRPACGYENITICHPPGRKRWNGGGGQAIWRETICHDRPDERRIHTAQKPLALMMRLVTLFTDPGELVCDPFAGGATTLVACRRLGRRGIGIELDEAICEAAARRLSLEPEPLFVPEAPAPPPLTLEFV